MNHVTWQAEQEIRNFVAAFGSPRPLSLAEDIHVFHFESEPKDWDATPSHGEEKMMFVNRNGHHFRLIWSESNVAWQFVNTWNGLYSCEEWMIRANLFREDPLTLIKLCGVGPQGKQTFEGLCLLPKDATTGRRKAVWRQHVIDVGFQRDNDTFYLDVPSPPTGGTLTRSPSFKGKPWESLEAARWCLANLPAWTGKSVLAAPKPKQDPQLSERELEELVDSPMWGMF